MRNRSSTVGSGEAFTAGLGRIADITESLQPAGSNMAGIKVEDTRICVVMVGLPARGKSLISQKVVRYLRWLSIPSKVFNVGNYRRNDTPQPTADFFDEKNTEGERLRHAAAQAAVDDMVQWFDRGEGNIAMLDATNSTKSRRKWVHEACEKNNIRTLFVESVCDDEELIMNNIRDVKTTSPDYKGQDPEQAAQDFRNRIRNYERVYQTIDEDENDMSYVKLIDVGTHVIINQLKDYLQSRVVYYLMNLHIKPRSIWLSRHGESMYNLSGKIGGDSDISPRGELYARRLPSLVQKCFDYQNQKLILWTSTLRRTIQTGRYLSEEPYVSQTLEWKALDELDGGACDGLTYKEIKEQYPEDFAARDEDKYNYRYRAGESYRDVVVRLEPIIMELERTDNVMIITHQAVLRCIMAYYMDLPQERSPWQEVPLHTLIRLTPRAYGTQVDVFKADIPAVSTWRGKGSAAEHQTADEETMAKISNIVKAGSNATEQGELNNESAIKASSVRETVVKENATRDSAADEQAIVDDSDTTKAS